MIKLLLLSFLTTVSFYTYNVQTLSGGSASFAAYQGKKILLVNIASRGQYTGQIQELQQLYQQHSDSLVIIAFPTNSFGNEPHSNTGLQELFTDSFHVSYPVAALCEVTGSGRHAVYEWLADSTLNGTGNILPNKDFQKILIGKNGKVTGIFNSMVSPLDSKIQQAIAR